MGGLSLLGGFTLPRWMEVAGSSASKLRGPVKSVIMFNLLGGPSHLDKFDLKPDAPEGIRGELRPIATSLPGVRTFTGEGSPNRRYRSTVRQAYRASVLRARPSAAA